MRAILPCQTLSRCDMCVSSKHGNRWPKRNGRILDRCGSVYNKTFSKNNTPSRKGRDAHISGLFILNILETWNKSVKSTAKQIWLCFRYASHSIHDVPVMINNGVIGCVCVCVWETRNDFDRDEFHEVVAKRGNWLWNFEEILCATTESESFFLDAASLTWTFLHKHLFLFIIQQQMNANAKKCFEYKANAIVFVPVEHTDRKMSKERFSIRIRSNEIDSNWIRNINKYTHV